VERDLSAIVDMVNEAFPSLEIITDLEEWLTGNFKPPCAFIQTQAVTEKGNTLTSYKVISDAGIVLHFQKEKAVYLPISTEPLRNILRREKYSYKGLTDGLFIDIDSDALDINTEKKDRAEITFRFEYRLAIPKPDVSKINDFEIEVDE